MAAPKPPVSAWIAAERKGRAWKVEELSRRLKEAGYEAEVSTIRVWEAGRTPAPETIEGLERLFGSKAPRDVPAQTDTAALVAAIDRQTAAIGELVDAIRGDRVSLSPEGARLWIRSLIQEGVIVLPEPLPAEVATGSEPQPQGAGRR